MTDQQIRQAIAYNRQQGFTSQETRLIQGVVEVEEDGLWGRKTVEGVWRWQDGQGIRADGKVWRSARGDTWPRLRLAAEMGSRRGVKSRFEVSLWIDDTPQQALQGSFADALQELGVSSAAIMVNASNTSTGQPGWKPRWSAEQIAQAAQLLNPRGIDLILTAWPRPSRDQIATLCAAMKEGMEAGGALALEVDVEGNWTSEFLEGFASLSEAGEALAEKLRLVLPAGARLELTSYPYHREFSTSATISPHVDVLLPQAYSVYDSGDAETHWGAALGPGNMQNLSIVRARRVSGPQVACGVAAYFQERYPDHSSEQAMQTALNAVAASGVFEIRYWSSKWIVGRAQNGYSKEFVANIAKA